MIEFKLSAFADEYSPEIDKQIEWLTSNGVGLLEIRGVDGTPIADISLDKAREVKCKLDKAGLGISAIGSPAGKINIKDDFDAHLVQFRHLIDIAHILEAKRMRIFSFFMPEGEDPAIYRDEVVRRLNIMCDIAQKEEITLCHENEKQIYGETPERCRELYEATGGRMKCVFDHANFIACDIEPYPRAYSILKDTLCYMHIKDANLDKEMVVAGEGIGRIPETLASVKKDFDGEFILTLEPHLLEFDGLKGLESEGHTSNVGNKYKNTDEAFGAALAALKAAMN
ncbi:MAG: sugar phosphate isomerase/epimerase [Clostridia bacterium]|nr:sugar phosphate isomerase/epimerase [Clostridia bacterium]